MGLSLPQTKYVLCFVLFNNACTEGAHDHYKYCRCAAAALCLDLEVIPGRVHNIDVVYKIYRVRLKEYQVRNCAFGIES